MSVPRLRLIAGPNGSGKTTLTNNIRQKLGENFGIYVNADEIEVSLREQLVYDFATFGVFPEEADFRTFYESHPLRDKAEAAWGITGSVFFLAEPLPQWTYFPTLFADFVREMLLKEQISFVFETVMSDAGKINLLQRAQAAGYRTYLYYVCLEDPLMNVARVADRVQNKGHAVPEAKIIDRWSRSLNHLLPAVRHCNRSYFWDNSGTEHRFIGELSEGEFRLQNLDFVPAWFETFLLQKIL